MKLNYLNPKTLIQKQMPLPDKDVIDICIFSIENFSQLESHMYALSPHEQKRASVFRQEKDRLRFITSRILLRRILSLYLDYPPEKLLFEAGKHGKPFLSANGNDFPDIHFNLSHSGEFIALAFSSSSPVGIDIETARTNIRTETLVRRFFHPDEYQEFLKLDENAKKTFVFRRWTVREAFLKGIGSGFSKAPDSFYVQALSPGFCIKKSQEDYSSWRIDPVSVPDGYYCSIAYQIPV